MYANKLLLGMIKDRLVIYHWLYPNNADNESAMIVYCEGFKSFDKVTNKCSLSRFDCQGFSTCTRPQPLYEFSLDDEWISQWAVKNNCTSPLVFLSIIKKLQDGLVETVKNMSGEETYLYSLDYISSFLLREETTCC